MSDDSQGKFGVATDKVNEVGAWLAAEEDCHAKGGLNCTRLISYRNECIAMVLGDKTYSFSAGATASDAIQHATQKCMANTTLQVATSTTPSAACPCGFNRNCHDYAPNVLIDLFSFLSRASICLQCRWFNTAERNGGSARPHSYRRHRKSRHSIICCNTCAKEQNG